VDQGLPVCFGRLDDLPPEAAVDRATYAGASIRSSLTVPMPIGQHVEHLIAVQTVRTEAAWPAAHVARIRLLGEMLVNAVERARSYLAIAARERRASVAADSADAGLWVLDLATNGLWMSDRARGPAGPAQTTSGGA
jgi:GAF domain-containing protein